MCGVVPGSTDQNVGVASTTIHTHGYAAGAVTQWEHMDLTQAIDHNHFMETLAHYPIIVINFYAPWCHWCQRLEPAWEAATKEVHEKYPEGTDGRIRFAKVSSGSAKAVVDSIHSCCRLFAFLLQAAC